VISEASAGKITLDALKSLSDADVSTVESTIQRLNQQTSN